MPDQAQKLRQMFNKRVNSAGPRIITVTSGKGGVGKSAFAVNLAIALAKAGSSTLIVDADFGLANIDIMLGVTPEHDLASVIHEYMDISEVISECYDGVKFISGGSGVFDLLNLKDEQLDNILFNLLQLEELADIIIFDTGAGVNDNVLRMVKASTETILITTPEPTAILDAYALLKTLSGEEDTPPIKLVVNKAYTPKEAGETLNSFINIVHKYMPEIQIDGLGYVINDPSVTKAVKMQSPVMISFPRSIAAQNINEIAQSYLSVPVVSKGGIAQFVAKFIFKRNASEA